MKPSFALIFSHDGISLLHRVTGGWRRVDTVSLDDPEIDDKLKVMRKTANSLGAGRLACKLVIPNSQILFTSVTAPGPSDAERFDQIRASLDGLTPYSVDELAFDWDASGDTCSVAAVALETLAEAEGFAVQHKFNPVSFVATPDGASFRGEPFFGIAKAADSVLDGAEIVDRDKAPIVVLGDAKPVSQVADEALTDGNEMPEAPRATFTSTFQSRRDDRDEAPGSAVVPELPISAPSRISFVPVGGPVTAKPAAPLASDMKIGAKPPDQKAQDQKVQDQKVPDQKAPIKTPSVTAERTVPKPPPPLVAKDPLILSPAAVKPAGAVASTLAERLGGAAKAAAKAPPVAAQKLTKDAPKVTAKPAAKVYASAEGNLAPPKSEADALTVFGARKKAVTRGKPRYLGLILTAILLAFLAAIALWSTFFVPGGITGLIYREEPVTAVNDEAIADEAVIDLAKVLPQDLINPENQVAPVEFPSLDPAVDAEPAVQVPDPQFALPDPDEARAIYARTGAWVLPPLGATGPEEETLDTLYIASIEPVLASLDAIALPAIEGARDERPTEMLPPAALGRVFVLDESGRVVPSASGALSPAGIRVFAGKPKVVPTLRPKSDAPEPQAQVASLPRTQPRPRPGNLVEKNERQQLGGKSREELAALKPLPRPQSAQVAAAAAVANQAPTKFAVAVSPVPSQRPSNIAVLVAVARARVPEPAVAPPAASQPQQPQVAAAAPRQAEPSIPTRASVARRATVSNVLNLRKVNLIGVYGTPNDRRALVRLSNGRYVKVSVGDKVDGGKVSAIGETELRYIKRGRNVTLTMPSS